MSQTCPAAAVLPIDREAMHYGLYAGRKRIRPVPTEPLAQLPFAIARAVHEVISSVTQEMDV